MRSSRSITFWFGVALGLGFWHGFANLAAQVLRPATAKSRTDEPAILKSLAITITGPKVANVDQPIAIEVNVVNTSDQPTPATELQFTAFSAKQGTFMLKIDALKPRGKWSMPVTLAFNRIGTFDMGVFFGKPSPTLPDAIVYSFVTLAQVQVRFDPSMPPRAMLPTPPGTQSARPQLPETLEEVPEVALEARLPRTMAEWQARDHLASTIDKINHVSEKKADAYMQVLVHERPDLAGLPFMMGDACRMKKEPRRAFGDTVDLLRTARRDNGLTNATRIEYLFPVLKKQTDAKQIDADRANVAGLMQVLAPEGVSLHRYLVKYLAFQRNVEATKALAKLAIFSAEASIRDAAIDALKDREFGDYTDVLVQGLSYPWPAVAERASSAMARLARVDLIPQLRKSLDQPDPRAPELCVVDGRKVHVVRELVRINHHRNCLLCHAPGTSPVVNDLVEEGNKTLTALTAPILVPNVAFPATYYNENARPADILVRVDVTYLRQDFSVELTVPAAAPWPAQQRFDFLVRTREVSAEDAQAYRELLWPGPGARSPFHDAAMTALTALTNRPKD